MLDKDHKEICTPVCHLQYKVPQMGVPAPFEQSLQSKHDALQSPMHKISKNKLGDYIDIENRNALTIGSLSMAGTLKEAN